MFDGPVSRPVAKELVAASPPEYKWPTFKTGNDHVQGAFEADGWQVLDAYALTVLRPDSHIGGRDCLHYCVPGPADQWATMLYNMLAARSERRADANAGGEDRGLVGRETDST